MLLPEMTREQLERLTPEQLKEYVDIREQAHYSACRQSFKQYARYVEVPGTPSPGDVVMSDLYRLIKESRGETVEDDIPDDIELYPKRLNPAKHHDLIMDTIEGMVLEKLRTPEDEPVDGVMLFMPPGSAKPIWDGSRVLTGMGIWRELKYIKKGELVITKHGRVRRVLEVHDQGELDCLSIKTHAGRELIAEASHPILTASGWVKAGDLVEGDLLAIMAGAMCGSATSVKPDDDSRAALAGYLVGDGSVSRSFNQNGADAYNAIVTNDDPDILAHVVEVAEKSGFKAERVQYKDKRPGIEVVRLAGGIRQWLRDIGLAGGTSQTKEIPKFVMMGNDDVRRAFLGAYMACDGSVYSKKGRHGTDHAACDAVTVSAKLSRQLQHLFLRLGIDMLVNTRRTGYIRKDGSETVAHRITARSNHDVWKIAKELGPFWRGRKAERFDQFNYRQMRIDQTLLGDRVVSITHVGKRPCRCLTVDEDESFVAEDIVVHNSTYSSMLAPAYFMSRFSNFNVIVASYAQQVANRFSRRARSIAASDSHKAIFPETSFITEDVQNWELSNGSEFRAAGILAAVTSFRADLLIVDDPVAGREEAESELIPEKIHEAYSDDLVTRLKPNAKQCIIMTRWAENDLAGMILGEDWDGQSGHWKGTDGKNWYVVCLPRLAEHADDPLGRAIGELLWPEWFSMRDTEILQQAARRGGSAARTWASLHQQRPSPVEGSILMRSYWREWKQKDKHGDPLPPRCDLVLLAYDTAIEEGEENDWSAMTAWGVFDHVSRRDHTGEEFNHPHLIMLGAWRERLQAADLADAVEEQYRFFRMGMKQPPRLLVEKRASGHQLIQELRRRNLPVRQWLPKGRPGAKGKVPRAHGVAMMLEQGSIWYVPGKWTQLVIDECAAFPNGRYDDFVDTVTCALTYARDHFWFKTADEELEEEDRKAYILKQRRERNKKRRLYGGDIEHGIDDSPYDNMTEETKRQLYGNFD